MIDGAILEANVIPLGMYDVDVILGMIVQCDSKKIMFKKLRYPKLEFEGDRRILPMCVILTLERLGDYYTKDVRHTWHI